MKLEKRPACAPSILAADFTAVGKAVELVEKAGCPWIHLDIMDGHFVPNLTFGPKMVSDIRNITDLFLDAHLMTSNPEDYIERYIDAGADAVTIHLEASVHVHRMLQKIKSLGAACGISIVPSTPAEHLNEILDLVDLILVMSVNPGYGGQALIPRCIDKVRYFDTLRKERSLEYLISVDGGVNRHNAASVIRAGTDILVAGTAFFGAEDPISEAGYLLCEKTI